MTCSRLNSENTAPWVAKRKNPRLFPDVLSPFHPATVSPSFPAFRHDGFRRFRPTSQSARNTIPFLRRINPDFFAISVCILTVLILYYIDCSCSFPPGGKEELHLKRPPSRTFRLKECLHGLCPCGRTNIRKNTDMSAANRMSSRQMPYGIRVSSSPRPSSVSAAFDMKQPLSGSRTGMLSHFEAGSTKVPLLRQANMDVSALMLAIFCNRKHVSAACFSIN